MPLVHGIQIALFSHFPCVESTKPYKEWKRQTVTTQRQRQLERVFLFIIISVCLRGARALVHHATDFLFSSNLNRAAKKNGKQSLSTWGYLKTRKKDNTSRKMYVDLWKNQIFMFVSKSMQHANALNQMNFFFHLKLVDGQSVQRKTRTFSLANVFKLGNSMDFNAIRPPMIK